MNRIIKKLLNKIKKDKLFDCRIFIPIESIKETELYWSDLIIVEDECSKNENIFEKGVEYCYYDCTLSETELQKYITGKKPFSIGSYFGFKVNTYVYDSVNYECEMAVSMEK